MGNLSAVFSDKDGNEVFRTDKVELVQPCGKAQPRPKGQGSAEQTYCINCGYPIVHLYMDIWIHIVTIFESDDSKEG